MYLSLFLFQSLSHPVFQSLKELIFCDILQFLFFTRQHLLYHVVNTSSRLFIAFMILFNCAFGSNLASSCPSSSAIFCTFRAFILGYYHCRFTTVDTDFVCLKLIIFLLLFPACCLVFLN